jgi:hypothetical protein
VQQDATIQYYGSVLLARKYVDNVQGMDLKQEGYFFHLTSREYVCGGLIQDVRL